jgi:aspartyl/asparaginyl-tRNA synthetase
MKVRAVIVFCLLLGLVGCGASLVTVSQIKSHPRDYVGREVRVQGVVTDFFTFGATRFFSLSDDTGQITVLTRKVLPARGERMTVSGVVAEGVAVGSWRQLVIREAD